MFRELFDQTDKVINEQDVGKILARFKDYQKKGYKENIAAMMALSLDKELAAMKKKRSTRVKEALAYVITDLGDRAIELKDDNGIVRVVVDRYGVWKWNPTKERHEVIETGNDLEALQKKYPDAEVVRAMVREQTIGGEPYAGYTPHPEEYVTDYYGEQIYEEDIVELAPGAKYYDEYKGVQFRITTLEATGERHLAYLQGVDEPDIEITEWSSQVQKVG
jgi:hypothetical protein